MAAVRRISERFEFRPDRLVDNHGYLRDRLAAARELPVVFAETAGYPERRSDVGWHPNAQA